MESLEKAIYAASLAKEKKAIDVVILDVRGTCVFTDLFVICTGRSALQLRAVAQSVEEGLKKEGFLPLSIDGLGLSTWTALDFGDVVIHVMNEEARGFYALEKLWGDARIINDKDIQSLSSNSG